MKILFVISFMQLSSRSKLRKDFFLKCSFLLAVKETNQRKAGTSQIFILHRSTAAPRNLPASRLRTSHSAFALFASHITKSAQCALTPYALVLW